MLAGQLALMIADLFTRAVVHHHRRAFSGFSIVLSSQSRKRPIGRPTRCRRLDTVTLQVRVPMKPAEYSDIQVSRSVDRGLSLSRTGEEWLGGAANRPAREGE